MTTVKVLTYIYCTVIETIVTQCTPIISVFSRPTLDTGSILHLIYPSDWRIVHDVTGWVSYAGPLLQITFPVLVSLDIQLYVPKILKKSNSYIKIEYRVQLLTLKKLLCISLPIISCSILLIIIVVVT